MKSLVLTYFTFSAIMATTFAASIQPIDVRCEYHHAPLAVDTILPRFSWKIQPTSPESRNLSQSAYEIEVVSDSLAQRRKVAWKSGKISSQKTDQITYAGEPLKSRDPLTWRVRTWDQNDTPSEWSAPTSFSIGLLDPGDWSALWISAPDDQVFTTKENIQNFIGDPTRGFLHLTPAKVFRKEFSTAPITRALVHATALGVYNLEINGRRVSQERLAPGWSAYQRRIHSQTYDVTSFIKEGTITIPPNTTAEVTLPVSGPILEDGKPLGSGTLTLGSGTYRLTGTN